MKFKVTFAGLNAEQIAGTKSYEINNRTCVIDDFVEAEDASEAVDFAIDWLIERTKENNVYSDCSVERIDDTISIYDEDGNEIEQYTNFKAEIAE